MKATSNGLAVAIALALWVGIAQAHSGAVAVAAPVSGITVDGCLDDWPADLARYRVDRVEEGAPPQSPLDFQGWFRLGYDPAGERLLVAVETEDESLVGPAPVRTWNSEDACELYLGLPHEAPVAGQFVSQSGNPSGSSGTNAQMRTARQAHGMVFEWSLPLPHAALPPPGGARTLAFDVVLCDRDGDGSFSWLAWGRGIAKSGHEESRGDLLLVAAKSCLSLVTCRIASTRHESESRPGMTVDVCAADSSWWVRSATDRLGVSQLALPAGDCEVNCEPVTSDGTARHLRLEAGQAQQIDLTVPWSWPEAHDAPLRPRGRAEGYRHGPWQVLDARDGLGPGRVNCLVPDAAGYLWMGTDSGLLRYDGFQLDTLDLVPDARVAVRAMALDRLGTLWFATDRGLFRYEGGSVTRFGVEHGLASNDTRGLLADRQGSLWIATTAGLSRWRDSRFDTFTASDGLGRDLVLSLAEDPQGVVWAANGALYRFDGQHTFARVQPPGDRVEVRALYSSPRQRLLIGTGHGLLAWDGHRMARVDTHGPLPYPAVHRVLEDSRGGLWLVTAPTYYYDPTTRVDLSRWDGVRWRSMATMLGYGGVWAMAEDREGNIWAGMDGRVAMHDAGDFAVFGPADGLPSGRITSLLNDRRGQLWVGTDAGVSRADQAGFRTWTTADGLADTVVTALGEDRDGTVWVGTWGGLSRRQGDGFAAPPVSPDITERSPVSAIVADPSGGVWVATGAGLRHCNQQVHQETAAVQGLPTNSMLALARSADGSLWVGGWEAGVTRWHNGVVGRLTTADGLPSNSPTALLVDSGERLWMAMREGGVRWLEAGTLHRLTVREGLAHDNVRALAQDARGVLWLGTAGGVNQYDRQVCQVIQRRDGLPEDAITCLAAGADGTMWLGTANSGLVRYCPQRTPPPIRLTAVTTDQRHGPVDRVALAANQSLLRFEFHGISLRTPCEAMLYRYRLRGQSDDWQVTANPYAEFQQLPRGEYVFEAEAVDRDLNYSPAPVRVMVSVHWPYARAALGSALGFVGLLGALLAVQITRQFRAAQRARHAAENASRAKSAFLANMSHEIRTPMNAVVGMTDLLMDSEADPVRRSYLRTINTSADALLDVINDILDLSRIEAGRLALQVAPMDVWQLLDGVMKTLAIRAHEKGLELACQVAPEVPGRLVADATRMRQILVNLVGNAIKFTDRGEVIIRLDMDGAVEADRVRLHGSVRDTGIGVAEEHQTAIFQAFNQADVSTTRRFGGTGLGLAICAQLVHLMEGRIWVESQPGQGSTFHFTVTAGVTDNGSAAGSGSASPVPEGLRVLITDDNATNRLILSETAQRWRAQVDVATSGSGALTRMDAAVAEGHPFDLLITDLIMPQMDGLALVRAMQARPELRATAVVLLSSADDPKLATQAGALGVTQVLRKPVTRPEMEMAVGAALNHVAQNGTGCSLSPPPQAASAARRPPVAVDAPAVAGGASGPEPALPAVPVSSGVGGRTGLSILLAEDNQVNQLVATRMLTAAGHQVTVVADGVQALEAMATTPFHLVFMDVQMPNLDGLQATRQLREQERHRGGHRIIVGLTAGALREDRSACLEAGMDDFVAKPVRRRELLAVLDHWCPSSSGDLPAES